MFTVEEIEVIINSNNFGNFEELEDHFSKLMEVNGEKKALPILYENRDNFLERVSTKALNSILSDTTIYRLNEVNVKEIEPVGHIGKFVFSERICRFETLDRKINTAIQQIDLPLDDFGLVIAGGFFSNVYAGMCHSDVDLFVVASNREDAIQKVSGFMKFITDKLQDRLLYFGKNEDCVFAITPSSITFRLYDATKLQGFKQYQVILRYYDSPDQVIEKFDLAPTMVYYFQGQAYMNAEAAYAFKHRCIIINLEKRRSNFPYRLNKYVNRGFNIITTSCNYNSPNFEFDGIILTKNSFPVSSGNKNVINAFMSRLDHEGTQRDFYDSNKIYSYQHICYDNLFAIINEQHSNLTGLVDEFTLEYSPLFDIDQITDMIAVESIESLLVKEVINREIAHKMLDNKIDNVSNYEIIYQVISNICKDDQVTVEFEHYSNPIYEFRCPLDKSAEKFYGKHYVPQ